MGQHGRPCFLDWNDTDNNLQSKSIVPDIKSEMWAVAMFQTVAKKSLGDLNRWTVANGNRQHHAPRERHEATCRVEPLTWHHTVSPSRVSEHTQEMDNLLSHDKTIRWTEIKNRSLFNHRHVKFPYVSWPVPGFRTPHLMKKSGAFLSGWLVWNLKAWEPQGDAAMHPSDMTFQSENE